MAVKIGRGVRSALRVGAAFLQVRGGPHNTVWDVLCAIHAELMGDPDAEDDTTIVWQGEEVDWINWEGHVLDLPGGPGWYVDVSTWPADQRFSVVEVLAARLEAAGVTDATISVPASAGFDDRLGSFDGPGVVAYAHYQVKPTSLPDDWVGPVLPNQWINHGLGWTGGVERLALFGTGLPDIWIPPADAISIATRVHPRSPQLYLAADTGPNVLHAAVLVGAPFMPFLVEEAAGGLDRERLATEARRMAETILGLDPRPINAAVRFLPVAFPHEYSDVAWMMISDTGRELNNFEFRSDLIVPDGYWWQLLGAGHRDRLGGWPQGAEVIDGGEAAVVTFGRPEDWAEPTTAEAVRALARQTLAPIIAHNSNHVFDARRPGH